jgi:hypothetical protein
VCRRKEEVLKLQMAIGLGGMTFPALFVFATVCAMAKEAKRFSWRKKNIAQLWRDITAIGLALCSMLSGFVVLMDAIMRVVL